MQRVLAWTVVVALMGVGAVASEATSADPAACAPTTFTGVATDADEGAYLRLPFTVASGVTAVKVTYSWTHPVAAVAAAYGTTLDLGVIDPDGVRGWSGSGKGWPGAKLDVRGVASPDGERAVRIGPDWATPSYRPGPLPAGAWAVELGVAALAAGQATTFTVTVACSTQPAGPDAVHPPLPVQPVAVGPAWYAGDLHVHSHHSESPPPVSDVVAAAQARGLDFVSLTDHNAVTQYAEYAAARAQAPDLLLLRGTEVTTYRGHFNAHGSSAFKAYHAGDVYQVEANGDRTLLAPGQHANALLAAARADGAFTQINHPSFPTDPVGRNVCRGCGWSFEDTDFAAVDFIEIATGPAGTTPAILGAPEWWPERDARLGPNPLTPPAIAFWEEALRAGHRVTAVGGSDDHDAATNVDVTHSAVGTPTTVVFADALAEPDILSALAAGHAYIRLWGPNGPHLTMAGTNARGEAAMAGDAIAFDAGTATVSATVADAPAGAVLLLVTNGVAGPSAPVAFDGTASVTLPVATPGFHYAVVHRPGSGLLALSNPVYVT